MKCLKYANMRSRVCACGFSLVSLQQIYGENLLSSIDAGTERQNKAVINIKEYEYEFTGQNE